MNVTFVYPGAESLAIEYLSSALKKRGHKVTLAFDPVLFDDKQYFAIPSLAKIFSRRRRLIDEITASSPGLVAFSVGTDIYAWACDIAREVKKRIDVPVIFGGIHATALPDRVIKNDFVDMVCIGEGDQAIVELADSLESGKINYSIQNIWFKKEGQVIKNPVRSLLEDLDSLPLPDKGIFEDSILIKNGKYMIMTSRGCPFKCAYCYNDVLKDFYSRKGKYVRQRSIEGVLQELADMKKRYNYSNVAFMDDLFVGNRLWFKEFIKHYREEINVPYSCMTSTSVIDDEIASILKNTGCSRLQFGVQTMNEKTRCDILRRNFETTAHIEQAISACDKNGISYSLDHIFGIPYEREAEYKKTADFFVRTKADRICCYALFYYPKTAIINSAKEAGILDDKDIEEIEEGKSRLYVYGSSLKGDDQKLFNSFRKLYSLSPVLPLSFKQYLLKTGLYRFLRFVPRFIALFFEAAAALKTKHPRGRDYLNYYVFHLRRSLSCSAGRARK